MAQNNDVEKLYNALKRDGYDDLGTLDEFSSRVSDRDHARKLYEAMQRDGYDDLGTADDFYSRLNPQPAYKPTEEELAGFQNTVRQAQQTVTASQQAQKRIANRQKQAQKTNYGLTRPTVKLGQNSKVVEGDKHLNPETGKLESTYITEQGNEYRNREGADIEQNTVDLANHMQTLPGQLQDAYAERERLQAEIDAEIQRAGYGQTANRSFAPQVPGSIPRQSAERLSNDRLQTLYAAQRQNEERITALEAERDDDGGTQFWRGFVDAAKNPSTWTFGATDFQNMTQLMRIKGKVDNGEELTDDEQSLLQNTMANGYAQQMFGENRGFMYRAGGISMQALPFVAEFMATGGFSSLTEMGANAGTRVAEKLALDGLKKTILRNTGVVMGDIASSFIMANTTGAARTGADIMERNIGQVTMDEEGNYQFEGGKSLGRSIYEGEVASTLEYYTEKLGEHLQLGSWLAKGADKMGLSKLSKAVNYLSNSKVLNAGGIQDYPSEVVEEQANLLLNAILVGDNNFSTDPNSKDFDKSVFNPQNQLDIWGGMMFSIGLMQAPRLVHTGYNAAGYYAYKHTTDVADANAGIVFGQDNWQMIREQIDNCDNEHLGELLQSVIDGDMNDVQKTAVMNYAGNLLKMRGYNMGMMSDVRGGEDFESEQGFLSHGIDQGYQQGHEAQEPDDKKLIIDEANEAEAQLSQFFTEQDIQWIASTSPMDAINVMLNNRGTEPGQWNDEEIAAVVDYYQKQARAQGVMDAAADDVEYQVAKANAEVDANTHKAVNMMILAESGGEQFYIVGGDVALTADVEEGKYLFDNERTGDALIVRNAETGEISVKSPQALSISLVHDPNQLKTANEVELRQQLVQQHEDEITFGSPAQEVFQLNDTVTLNDGQGNIIEGEIGMMPASIDGAYVVYTSDGRAMQLTDDDLNKMIIAHNGMEVQRTTLTAPVEQNEAVLEQETPPVEQNQQQSAQQQPEEEQPQSALDRIPFLQDEQGKPILNRKGKKQYQWHKASVDDTADALTETTGGDMLMARDTAKDLIEAAKGKLEKIRKQKPKGDDPIEIAEHRADIRRQEQEQQAIVKHWQDVNQAIQRRMQAESVRKEEERRAALTEEQRRQEDERKRQEQERRDQIAAERRKAQAEEELRNWNKPYQPLEQAKREMADDPDAMAILNDTEPQGLDEWVSYLLRPQSMMWADDVVDGRTVTGLQSELGLGWNDMQRFGALIGGKGKGKPFGQVVHEIWEDLPEGMKNQYNDQDVRNVLLSLFNESDSKRMRNLAAERRIEQAREMMKENQRREAEYEMEAWADFYHLTPEERETFEDFMQQPPMEPEQAIIDQIIADNESNTRSKEVDSQHPERTAGSEGEGGQGQVQGEGSQVEGVPDSQQQGQQGAEADTGGPSLSDNDVPGGILTDRIVDNERSERLKKGLTDAYASGDSQAIQQAVDGIRDYIEEGGDFEGGGNWDVEDYEGNDPHILTEQYITRALFDVYLDSDEDQEYIATGLRADMRKRFDEVEDSEKYASRFVENDDLEESETANGTEYHQTLTIDGQHIVEKVDAPDDKGYHTGSHYLFDGQRFGGLREVFEYIDGKAAETQQPTQQEAAQPFTSFEDMKANIPETVTDPAMQKALRKIVDKMFQHGSSNLRRDDRGFDYTFVYMAGGTTKTDRGLLQPWGSQSEVEYNDDNPTATWVDEKEQRIYFIKYNPEGTRYSWDFVITGYMAMPKPIGSTSTPEEIASEEAKVEQNPTEGQKEAGNYQKGHIKVDGYDITIENPKGSIRRGTDASGKQWEQEMHNTYGYIRGTEGVDGDHIDVFLSDTPTSGKVFVVDQVNSDGSFDEHKVMYGFASEEDARAAYLSNYSEGWQGLGAITPVSRKDFKKWVQSSHRKTKPFAEYKSVKKEPVAEPQAAQPAGEPAGTVANPSGNKLVTDERYAELKERMKKKLLGQMNMGIDPEILAIGTEMAVYHIEKGARQFVEYAKGMIADLGDAIRPYLKAFYNGARDLPEMAELSQGMDDYASVQSFDVFNFDKQQPPTPVEKAQQVVSQKKADSEAAEAVKKIQEIASKGAKKGGKKQQQQVQGPSLFDLFEETNTEESETNGQKTETNQAKTEKQHMVSTDIVKTQSEVDNALRETLIDEMRKTGINVVTDIEEGQRVLDRFNGIGHVKKMGTTTNNRMSDVAGQIAGAELTDQQSIITSVFTGEKDNQTATFKRDDGTTVKMKFQQGEDTKAGTKHSLYAHYGTTKGIISAQDILRIPEIIEKGERKQRGKNVEYTLKDGKTKYTVYAKAKGGGEVFQDFYSSWKVKNKEASTSKPSITQNGENTQGAQSNDVNVSSGAKVQQNSETDKGSEEKIDFQKAKEVSMKPIDADVPDDPNIQESLNMMNRVKGMPIEEVLSVYQRLNGQMLEEGDLNVDEHEMKVKREWMAEHGTEGLGKTMADHLLYLKHKYGFGKLQLRWELLDRLEKEGINPELGNTTPSNASAKLVDMRPKFFKTPDGAAYGYTYKGKIYIDPRIATSETPIHEYGHLWAEMKRQTAPEEWNDIKNVLLHDRLVQPIIERVRKEYPELAQEGREDDFIEEILTQFSGKRGAERLREIANQVAAENGGVFGKAEAVTAMQRLRNVLARFWAGVAKMMGWKYRNASEIADKMMLDMLEGVNPTEEIRETSDDKINEMRTYHGSSAEFEHFDHAKVGSGEGQAISGHGTYVTTSEGTARYYANVSSERHKKVLQNEGWTLNGEVVRDSSVKRAYDFLQENEGDAEKAIAACEAKIEARKKRSDAFSRLFKDNSYLEKALEYLHQEKENPGTLGYQELKEEMPDRQLYEVEIPDDTGENYFNLDGTLSKKQKDDIRKRFLTALDKTDEADYWRKNRDIIDDEWKQVASKDATGDTARGVMEQFLPQDEVSKIFSDMGYVGHKVKGSDGTTYIVFNESDLKIVDRMKFQKVGSEATPEDAPESMARQIYEDAVRDTGDKMMLTALLSALGSKEARVRFKHKFAESWFDYSRSIKAVQDAIEQATGKTVRNFENVWKALNAKSSVDNMEISRVMHDFIMPLSEFAGNMIKGRKIDGHDMTLDDVEKYMNAVHGIERNEAMAMKQAQDEYEEDIKLLRQQLENAEIDDKERSSIEATLAIKEARFKGVRNYMSVDAVSKWWNQWVHGVERGHNNGTLSDEEYEKAKKKMTEEWEHGWQYKYREKDYSGLTALFADDFGDEEVTEERLEQSARDYARQFEDIVGNEQSEVLWEHVKKLNDWSLRKSYESGLISKQQYEDTLSMYSHYVPLRGWHDDYAGDIYQYISRGEPAEMLQGVLKKAYGRRSRAARIFGTMAAMANTAIVQGNKNLVGQRMLNLAMNHSDSGLLMVSEQWYQKNADDSLVPLFPDLRDNMTADEMREEIERFEEQMKQREDAGEVETLKKKFAKEFPLHMAKWQEQRHAVRVLRNGRENLVYVLGNPRAAEAFNGLLNPHSEPNAVSDLISSYMRFLAKMQTSLSPEFLVSNFQRDVTTAATGAYVKYGMEYQQRFVKNLSSVMPLTALRGVKQGKGKERWGGIFSLLGKYDSGTLDMDDDMERLFKEFVEHGGMTGISYITRAEEYQASMEKVVKRLRQGRLGRVRNGMDAVAELVEFANKGIENATRFATYMTSRQTGKNITDSIFDAKEASLNFNMKGSGAWGNMLARRLYLYVNPAMQALRMLGTWYENDPLVTTKEAGKVVIKAVGKRFMKAAVFTLTASVASALLNNLLSQVFGSHGGDGDDDEKGDWWSLSEWNRYNFVNVINPFGKGYFHWSLPQELRPLWAIGQIGVDMSFDRITWQRGLQSMLLQLNNLSPLSFFEGGTGTDESIISSEIRTLTPSYVSTFTDAYGWNRDFLGHRITNQGDWNKNAPEWQRAGKNTPEWLIGVSRKWNEINGGRKNKKSWADSPYLNPSALYYIFTQQFGGIGSMSKRMFSALDQWRDPEQDVELRNMPFVPKFYVTTGDDYSKERVMNDKFWMYWNEFKDADYEIGKNIRDETMSDEERQRTIDERKADGTYQRWQVIDNNALDYIYNKVRGTEHEKDVRRMILEAVEEGKVPDYASLSENTKGTEQGKMWEEAYDRQTTSTVNNMTQEELFENYNKSTDDHLRRYMARRISKDAGASEDPYGKKNQKGYQLIYQQLRTAEDVRDDAVLLSYQEKARDSGNEKRKEEISRERKELHSTAKFLFGGNADKVVMKSIRDRRKKLLERLSEQSESISQ